MSKKKSLVVDAYEKAFRVKTDCEYLPDEDDYPYTDLIEEKIVKSKKGEIDVIKDVKVIDVIYCQKYVKDGTGIYSGWISNSQKMLRRGKVKELLASVVKIVDTGSLFTSNIVNRLFKVMISEDIGIAGKYDLVEKCSRFIKMYDGYRISEKTPDMILKFKNDMIKLVIEMGMSKKSRLVDNLICLVKIRNLNLKIKPEEKVFYELFDILKNKEIEISNLIFSASILMWMDGCNLEKTRYENIDLFGFERKRKKIYLVWNWIISESRKLSRELENCNKNLLEIYETSTDGILNLINAYLNLILFEELKDLKKEKTECDISPFIDTWENIEKYDVWIDSVSYDKHTAVSNHCKYRNTLFFFVRFGSKLKNIIKGPSIYALEKRIYCMLLKNVIVTEFKK